MKVITIGRSEENDVVVRDPHASRHHLQIIQHDDGHFTLSDFGSTNGTYVNGQKISGEIYLNMNDVVRIGNTVIPWRLYFEEGFQETTQINTPPQYGASVTEPSNPTMPVNKERHGFVTFWLWLGIVSSVLGIILNLFTYQNLTNLGYLGMDLVSKGIDITPFSEAIHPHILIWQIVSLIGGVCVIICYSLLLKWKKIGFWGAVAIAIIIAIVNVIMINLVKQDYMLIGLSLNLNPVIQVIATPISLIVLWAILQIKKNGVSCWKLLENPNNNETKRLLLWGVVGGIVVAVIIATILLLHNSNSKKHNDRLYSDIQSVFIAGDDIYAVGSMNSGSSLTDVPTLWKNGESQAIGNKGNFNKATSVYVSGEDVYVTVNESDNDQALLWKNGERQMLAEGLGQAEANCVYVDRNDVYVAGQKDGQPTLWKNGVPNSLGESGSATSVFVKDGSIYVAGYMGEYGGEAFLYILRDIEEMAFNLEMNRANSFFVTNEGDIYVAGEVNERPTLWKDGDFLSLEQVGYGSAESVAVNNAGMIVVTGIAQNPNCNAVVWVNGKCTQVDDILGYQAMSVVTDGYSFYIGGCSEDGTWSVYKYDGKSDFRSENLIRVSTKN